MRHLWEMKLVLEKKDRASSLSGLCLLGFIFPKWQRFHDVGKSVNEREKVRNLEKKGIESELSWSWEGT